MNIGRSPRGLLLAILGLALLAFSGACRAREIQGTAPAAAAGQAPVGTESNTRPTRAQHQGIGFKTRNHLDQHYEKHGAEFEGMSKEQYLAAAQALRDAPAGGNILEARRPDGTVSRFDRSTGAFIAFDSDLTIRTFFKPNDGERYFRRQINREH